MGRLLSFFLALALGASALGAEAAIVEALPTRKNGAYASSGEVMEVGFLTHEVDGLPGAVRWGLALQAYRAFDLVGRASGNASWAPLAVFEYAFPAWAFRPSLLLRAGYLFARRGIANAWSIVDAEDGLTLQPGFAIDLFKAARLHVAVRWRLLSLERAAGPMIHSNVAFDF